MREIKFRMWDKEDQQWLYAEPIYGFFPSLPMSEEVKQSDRYGDIQQFTGLKDKNGKEIYEGDICIYPWADLDQTSRANIEWFGGGFGLHGLMLNQIARGSIEVIGNLHETPELLK